VSPPELEEILTEGCRHHKSERNRTTGKAATYNCTLEEIAGYLNVRYATVSRTLKKD